MSAEPTSVMEPTRVEANGRIASSRTRPMLSSRVMANADVCSSAGSTSPSGAVQAGAMLGNYRLLFSVARGGMAEVWVARQYGARGFTKLVALKMILPDLAWEQAFQGMFTEEARLAGLIRHPNVCEVFELIELKGLLALSMEWVDGDTLARLLNGQGPINARVAARIVAEAAAGLHAAHELRGDAGDLLNLVHRDVSPQNILISRDGHVKLSDFGIAKALNGAREATAVGQVKGKASYMSPEQAQGRPLDRRSDVFSLGVVLYLATVGKRPFRADGAHASKLLRSLSGAEFEPPHRVHPQFPRELEAIIERALQRDPSKRYETAAALRSDLERWLAKSGPLLTEADVARVVAERRGGELEKRESSIREALTNLPGPKLGSGDGGGNPSAWTSTVTTPVDQTIRDPHGPAFSSSRQAIAPWFQRRDAPFLWSAAAAALLGLLLSTFALLMAVKPGDPPTLMDKVEKVAAAPVAVTPPPAFEAPLDEHPLPPLEQEHDRRTRASGVSSSRSVKPAAVRSRTATPPGAGKPRAAAPRIGPTERDL
jgi:serine/threonine protein kinase